MGPIKAVVQAAKNKDWKPEEGEIERLLKAWHDGKLGTIHPDLLRMYVDDAIPLSDIAKAWRIPAPVILEMYKKHFNFNSTLQKQIEDMEDKK